jgi:hypothetical protein
MAPKPKPGPSGSRKIIGTATSSYPKQLVQGSMATQSKIVEKKPGKKPSTKYSPKPMSDAAKRKASRAGAEKARQYTDLPARRPSPNPARTSYSPQQMTEFDKRKAGARGKATAKKTAPKSTAAQIAKRFGITAREARDIATALGTVGKAVKENRNFYGGDAVKNLKKQIAETGKAAVSGKRGTESDQIVSSPNYKGASAGFTGKSRDKAKNKPGSSVADSVAWYKKSKN